MRLLVVNLIRRSFTAESISNEIEINNTTMSLKFYDVNITRDITMELLELR